MALWQSVLLNIEKKMDLVYVCCKETGSVKVHAGPDYRALYDFLLSHSLRFLFNPRMHNKKITFTLHLATGVTDH